MGCHYTVRWSDRFFCGYMANDDGLPSDNDWLNVPVITLRCPVGNSVYNLCITLPLRNSIPKPSCK